MPRTASLVSLLVSSLALAQTNVQIGVPLSVNQTVAIEVHNDGWQAAKFTSYSDYAARLLSPSGGAFFKSLETVGVSPDDVSAVEASATCIAASTSLAT